MEFEGRIIRVLPTRGGTSQRGNEWKALPFVFAYYETPNQRWEDRILLETFDTKQMAEIAQFYEIGADGKVVVENGNVKLKVHDIKCECGFSHNVKEVTRKDGSGTATINEMKCYKLEIIGQPQQQLQQQPTAPPAPAVMPIPADTDDLPF